MVWIDADAEIYQNPTVFENIDNYDMAIHSTKGGHWLSGTLYFTPQAISFVKEWLVKTTSTEPDEITLLKLYRNTSKNRRPKLHMLPQEYNTVVHKNSNTTEIVIGHHIRPDIAPTRKVTALPPDEL